MTQFSEYNCFIVIDFEPETWFGLSVFQAKVKVKSDIYYIFDALDYFLLLCSI